VEHGYPVSQPPSLDTFIENPNTWTPWEALVGSSGPVLPTEVLRASEAFAEYFESLEVCPRP